MQTRYLLLHVLLLAMVANLCAQRDRSWDTLKYQGFHSRLILGIFQTYRQFNTEFREEITPGQRRLANSNFQAESNNMTGIIINYDKIILQIGLKSTPRQSDSSSKGNTSTFILQLNVGGNKFFFENTYRYFKGFYDNNTSRYDKNYAHTGKYFLQPSMVDIIYSTRFMYFTNHKKFAYRSAYAGNFRQLKSAATWVLSVNPKYFLFQNDSSFFPAQTRALYGEDAYLNRLSVYALGLNAGASVTLVLLKSLFLNVMFIVGPEFQWRNYQYDDRSSHLLYLASSGSVRSSFGINFKRCFLAFTSINDFTAFNSNTLRITNSSLSGSIAFGWRFDVHTPGFYRKIQQTKLYNSI